MCHSSSTEAADKSQLVHMRVYSSYARSLCCLSSHLRTIALSTAAPLFLRGPLQAIVARPRRCYGYAAHEIKSECDDIDRCLLSARLASAIGDHLDAAAAFARASCSVSHIVAAQFWRHGRSDCSVLFVKSCATHCCAAVLHYAAHVQRSSTASCTTKVPDELVRALTFDLVQRTVTEAIDCDEQSIPTSTPALQGLKHVQALMCG